MQTVHIGVMHLTVLIDRMVDHESLKQSYLIGLTLSVKMFSVMSSTIATNHMWSLNTRNVAVRLRNLHFTDC